MTRASLEERVLRSAEETLAEQDYVSAVDILIRIGFLHSGHVQEWRKGEISYLEGVIQANLSKISFAMECFRTWAKDKGLKPSVTAYLARTSGAKRNLRFSKSGKADIETAYRTHYVSPTLSEKKAERLQEKLEKPPELVVFMLVSNSQCSTCKKDLGKGNFLLVEGEQSLCLSCAGLGELAFLPSGNALLTRRAKKNSTKFAVVVRFSRTRKRYERQGILVEQQALDQAEASL